MFLRDFSGNGVGASTEHCPSGDHLITEMLDKARKILALGILKDKSMNSIFFAYGIIE